MISEAEIRRNAGKQGIDPMIIEKDYVLGCYLHFLGTNELVQNKWIFKGGTCLRKCYFPDYRFSEDLDFTLKNWISKQSLQKFVREANSKTQSELGISFNVRNPVIEIVSDEYGKESYEVRIYYRGPWKYSGSPPSIRIHLNRDEILAFPEKAIPSFIPIPIKMSCQKQN